MGWVAHKWTQRDGVATLMTYW